MRLFEILESRKNPELNKKYPSGIGEIVAWTRTKRLNVGIHMGALPKLGINPGMMYTEDTPRGIYFYPISYWLDIINRGKSPPMSGNMPYIHAFTYDESNVYDGSQRYDINQVIKILKSYNIEDSAIENAISSSKGKYAELYEIIFNSLYNRENQLSDDKNITLFNTIFQKLGYSVIVDYGNGYIAQNEPFQGVVLTTSAIQDHIYTTQYERKQ
jgi:hypothetical protein